MNKIAAIYCRVSTDKQEQEGTSLDSQLSACLKLSSDRGYEVKHQYQESMSGLNIDRPKLNELRELARNKKIDVIICYALDRLSRDPVHLILFQDEFEKNNIELILVTETIDSSDLGKLILHVRGYAAKLETLKIKERTTRGRKTRALSGKVPSGSNSRLFGYDYIPASKGESGKRIIDQAEAKTVKDIFEWYLAGETTYTIAMKLRGLNIPTPKGGKWFKHSVSYILSNTAYIGKTYCYRMDSRSSIRPKEEWIELPGYTPAIIDEKVFNAVQEQIRNNRHVPKNTSNRQYLLHGHIFCKRCGKMYWSGVRTQKKNGKQYEYRRYRCSGRHGVYAKVRCDNPQVTASSIENQVWAEIEKLIAKPKVVIAELNKKQKEANLTSISSLLEELNLIQRQLKEVEKQQGLLLKSFLMGFSEEQTKEQNKELAARKDELLQKRNNLEQKITIARDCQSDIEGIQQFCVLLNQKIKLHTYEDKRLALKALDIKVWIDGDNVDITGALRLGAIENNSFNSVILYNPKIYPFSIAKVV